MNPSGNNPGAVYNNSAFGRAQGIALPAFSENATTRVFNGAIGDLVFEDRDGNGRFNGIDLGIGNVTVNVYTAGPDAIIGTADDVLVGSRITDGSGRWYLDGLNPGNYWVEIPAAALAAGGQLASFYPSAGGSAVVNADMNEESANLLALNTQQSLGVNALSLASQQAQSVLKLLG